MDDNYTIRPMMKNELDFSIELAAIEGWNSGLQDSDCFYEADNNGFFLGLLNDEPIACLPGMTAQQSNYKKSGFRAAYRNIRYQGLTGGKFPNNPELVELTNIPFAQIYFYDAAFFPTDRAAFLKLWLAQPDSVGLGIIQENQIVAYGLIRPCREGYKIAPLFADSSELAEILWLGLNAAVQPKQPVFLDVGENNRHALALVDRHKMQTVFETMRMYTRSMSALDFERIYGITSFELG
jgi:hypothetical protein